MILKKTITNVGLLITLTGIAVLFGWFLDIPLLKSIVPHYVTMKFNTALSFVLAGFILFLLARNQNKKLLFIFNILFFSLTLAALLQVIYSKDFGIDEYFIEDKKAYLNNNPHPGRMATMTVLCFMFLSISFLMLQLKKWKELAHYSLHVVTVLSFIAIVGYLLDVPEFYKLSFLSSMAIHTAISFLLLSVAATLLNPKLGFTGLFVGNKAGNIMARKLFPMILIIILIFSVLRVSAFRFHLVSHDFGVALFATSFVLISLVLIRITANSLNQIDRKKELVEATLLEKNLQMEIALRDFRSLFDSTHAAIVRTDLKGNITHFNKGAEQLLGYTSEEVVGKQTPELFHIKEEVVQKGIELSEKLGRKIKGIEIFTSLAKLEEYETSEWNYLHKKGQQIPTQVKISAIEDGNKNCIGYMAIIVDITQLKNTETRLREFEYFFNINSNYCSIINVGGFFEEVNQQFISDTGYTKEELTEADGFSFGHPDDLQNAVEVFEKAIDGATIINHVSRFRKKDGSYFWCESNGVLDLSTGKIYSTGRDITEKKIAEEQLKSLAQQLQKQNKQLSNFAQITSHNLRAPVSNLNALLYLYKESETPEERAILFTKFETVIKHLTDTLNYLVEALKIQSDLNTKSELLYFEGKLEKTKEILAGQILQSKAKITHAFSKAPSIYFPSAYLESIILNLCSNAIKYRSEERALEIHLQTEIINGQTIFKISDNGIGIDLEKHHKNIFGLNKTFHRRPDAKGVGLFMVKTQIEAMGGKVSVDSEVERGSSFSIKFKAENINL